MVEKNLDKNSISSEDHCSAILEKSDNLNRTVTVELLRSGFEKLVSKRMQELSKTLKLQGFRPGKIPMSVVERNYGESLRSEVMQKILMEEIESVCPEEIVGEISLLPEKSMEESSEKNSEFIKLSASFEVIPEIELNELSTISVRQFEAEELTEQDVDYATSLLQKNMGEWIQVEEAQEDDRIVFCIKNESDDSNPDAVAPKQFNCFLDKQDIFIPLLGIKSGEERIVSKAFLDKVRAVDTSVSNTTAALSEEKKDKTQNNTDLAEISQEKKLLCHSVHRLIPKKIEEISDLLKVTEDSQEKVRDHIRDGMNRAFSDYINQLNKQYAMLALYSLVPKDKDFLVPQAMIKKTTLDLLKEAAYSESKPLPPENGPDLAQLSVNAQVRVRGLLITRALNKKYQKDFIATPNQIFDYVKEAAEDFEDPANQLRLFYSDRNYLENIKEILSEKNMIDFIVSEFKIQIKSVKFSEMGAIQLPKTKEELSGEEGTTQSDAYTLKNTSSKDSSSKDPETPNDKDSETAS